MHGDGSAATVMLGLAGFVLLAVSQVDGELEQAVETTAVEEFCRGCGVRAVPHGRRPVRVRDLPVAGRPVTLIWVKRVWRCAELRCSVRTWTEASEHIVARASLTERARAEACRRVGEDGHDVAAVAVEYGVGWHTIMRAVRDHGRPLIDDPARLSGVSAVGVDETAFLAATASHATEFVTGIVDLTGRSARAARLLDVVEGRSAKALSDWVSDRDRDWRDQIEVAALDPFRGYATALRTQLPAAVRVLDAFHVTRLGLAAVDEVRRRVQQESLHRRGHRDDPLYRIRRLLRRAPETLSARAWTRLETGLVLGDPHGQVTQAWMAAHELRYLYRRGRDLPDARRRLHDVLSRCVFSEVPELLRLARTLDAWTEELLAYFTTGGISNGPTEAINLLIKRIKRVGFGFRNFDNYRLRLLLHCGTAWHTQTATPIRGREPRLVA
ncbi:MAG TPA: ISL3 family transposase [Streptomyces sp.]